MFSTQKIKETHELETAKPAKPSQNITLCFIKNMSLHDLYEMTLNMVYQHENK